MKSLVLRFVSLRTICLWVSVTLLGATSVGCYHGYGHRDDHHDFHDDHHDDRDFDHHY